MTTMLDLGPAAAEAARLLDGVRDDQLAAPTPSVTPVAALLDHLMGLTAAFRAAAEKAPDLAPDGPESSADQLDPGWRTELPKRLDALAEAWRDPAAWEGMTAAGGMTMPGEVTAAVAMDELVLHSWDLAKATGQDFRCDEASLEAVYAFTAEMSEPGQEADREGLFGPVVPVPADASRLDHTLGFSGRDPQWAPPG